MTNPHPMSKVNVPVRMPDGHVYMLQVGDDGVVQVPVHHSALSFAASPHPDAPQITEFNFEEAHEPTREELLATVVRLNNEYTRLIKERDGLKRTIKKVNARNDELSGMRKKALLDHRQLEKDWLKLSRVVSDIRKALSEDNN